MSAEIVVSGGKEVVTIEVDVLVIVVVVDGLCSCPGGLSPCPGGSGGLSPGTIDTINIIPAINILNILS